MVDVEYSVEYAACNFKAGGLFYPEDGERMFLRNVYIYIYISLHGITSYKTICIINLLSASINKKRIEVVQDKI